MDISNVFNIIMIFILLFIGLILITKSVNKKEILLIYMFFMIILIVSNIIAIIGFSSGRYIIVSIILPIMILVSLYFILVNNILTLEFIFLITIFQNIGLTLLSRYIDNNLFTKLLMFKEVYIILLVLASIIKLILKSKFSTQYIKERTVKADYISIFIGIIILLYTVGYGAPSINTRLISARQVIIPVLFYLLGRSISVSKQNLMNYFNFIKNFTLVIVIFGIIEISLGNSLWIELGIGKFIEYKGMQDWSNIETGLPGNFYSFDFYNQLGRGIRRMVSFIMEPTTLSQLMAMSLVYIYWLNPNKNNKLEHITDSIIIVIGILLTLGKGGMVVATIAFIYCIKYIKEYRLFSKSVSFIGAIIGMLIIIYSFSNKTSISFHLTGLIENFMDLSRYPIGRGIGMAGNFADLYATNGVEVGHGESYIGVILGQFGLIGLMAFYMFYKYIFDTLKIIRENNELKELSIVCIGLLLGTIVASFLSESAISFISTYLLFPTIGMLIRMSIDKSINGG